MNLMTFLWSGKNLGNEWANFANKQWILIRSNPFYSNNKADFLNKSIWRIKFT